MLPSPSTIFQGALEAGLKRADRHRRASYTFTCRLLHLEQRNFGAISATLQAQPTRGASAIGDLIVTATAAHDLKDSPAERELFKCRLAGLPRS